MLNKIKKVPLNILSKNQHILNKGDKLMFTSELYPNPPYKKYIMANFDNTIKFETIDSVLPEKPNEHFYSAYNMIFPEVGNYDVYVKNNCKMIHIKIKVV